MKTLTVEEALAEAVRIFDATPPDLLNLGYTDGESRYVHDTLPSYRRTLNDIASHFRNRGGCSLSGLRVAELGAFLGIVSKSLSLMGAKVIACDIPSYMETPTTLSYYRRLEIETSSFNLRDYRLPFASNSLDAVVACETFEHLNFNPLPIFFEISRVLKPSGVLYIAMPNGGYALKRLKFLIMGRMPLFTVDELRRQLDPREGMIVGLHWREYTVNETLDMVLPHGFKVVFSKQTNDTSSAAIGLQARLRSVIRKLTPGGHTQVHLFEKTSDPTQNYYICKDS